VVNSIFICLEHARKVVRADFVTFVLSATRPNDLHDDDDRNLSAYSSTAKLKPFVKLDYFLRFVFISVVILESIMSRRVSL
jgi:hypothetical protein